MAEHALRPLFHPRSIAVVGGSDDPNKIGGRPVHFLKRGGFAGPIYPVNPRATEVQGLRAYPGLRAIGAHVDQAIIAVPAEQAMAAFEDCVAVGVKSVVMFSAGFGEAGAAGMAMQRQLMQRAHSAGIRVLGPNSLGMFNVAPGVFNTFTISLDTSWPEPGGIAMVSQSGAFASYCYALAEQRGLRFGALVATGNEADVDVAECIGYFAEDPATRVIMAYREGCKNGPALIAALRAARARGKPVIVVKVGASEAGAAAAASHTGSLAGADAVFDAVFRDCGAYRAHSLDEMIDAAYAASIGTPARGRRLAVVTTSGGVGAMLADAASAAGLELPVIADESQVRIKTLLPLSELRNPVDTTAQIVTDTSLFARVMDEVLEHTAFDIVIAFLAQAGLSRRHFDPLRDKLFALRRRHPHIPFIMTLATTPDIRAELEAEHFLVFEDPVRALSAARALALMVQPVTPAHAPVPPERLPPGPLNEIAAARLLAEAGIPMAGANLARTADEAVTLANGIGYPVVLKIVSDDIAHKTDAGGVLLRVPDAAAVRAGFAAIMAAVGAAAPEARLDGILVAPHIAGGVEIILGAKTDPVFGPVVIVGLGGILVELFADSSLRLAPVTEAEARIMIADTRAGKLLAGRRGAAPGDIGALARAVAALSRFAAAHAEDIESIDINPLVVSATGVIGLDALILRRATGEA